jgi:hypothetical protein
MGKEILRNFVVLFIAICIGGYLTHGDILKNIGFNLIYAVLGSVLASYIFKRLNV